MSVTVECYFALNNSPVTVSNLQDELNRNAKSVEAVERYWKTPPRPFKNDIVPPYWSSETNNNLEDQAEVTALMRENEVCFRTQSLWLYVYPQVALLTTLARWRGFLTIRELRLCHRTVAHEIARILNSSQILWASELIFETNEIEPFDSSMESIQVALRNSVGAPSRSTVEIAECIKSATKDASPNVWYLEDADTSSTS